MKLKLSLDWILPLALLAYAGACGLPAQPTAPEPLPIQTTPDPLASGPGKVTHVDPAFFPAGETISGWEITQPAQAYNHDNLFDLVNGQSDSFFAYGFEGVSVQRYQNSAGTLLGLEIWRFATPADAYGVFSMSGAGQPVALGNAGDADPGRRLAFWQDRYYVRLIANGTIPDEDLIQFGQAVAAALPTGGEPPAIVMRLPADGLQSAFFFHEEISLMSDVWLGAENLLGLGPQTQGALGRYTFEDGAARLLLIQYPDPEAATAGLAGLNQADLPDLLASATEGSLLGAVTGEIDQHAAQELLQKGLQP